MPLTKEEKKAKRAQKKLEKKLRLQEKKNKIKRDYLLREIKYGTVSVHTHEKFWKQMLTDIALPNMRDDMEQAWHNFEYTIDAKDFTISLLMDELKAGEEQYMLNLSNNFENIEKILLNYRDILDYLRNDNMNQMMKFQDRYDACLSANLRSSSENEEYLKTMLYNLEITEKRRDKKAWTDYFCKVNEESDKYDKFLNIMKGKLENAIQSLYFNTKKFLSDYASNTEELKKAYEELKIREDAAQQQMRKQVKKISNLQLLTKTLLSKYADMQGNEGQILDHLTSQRKFFTDALFQLKNKIFRETGVDSQKRTKLSVDYYDTITHLQKIEKKGEIILQLHRVSRKYETLEEKVLPFQIDPDIPSAIFYKRNYQNQLLFCQKIGLADTSRYALAEEKQALRIHNANLRNQIAKYCKCLDCPQLPPIPLNRASIPRTDGVDMMRRNDIHNRRCA